MVNEKTGKDLGMATDISAESELNEVNAADTNEMTEKQFEVSAKAIKKTGRSKKAPKPVKSVKSARKSKTDRNPAAVEVGKNAASNSISAPRKRGRKPKHETDDIMPAGSVVFANAGLASENGESASAYEEKAVSSGEPASETAGLMSGLNEAGDETGFVPSESVHDAEMPVAAAAPRKAGRPKGSKNIVAKAITVNATVIPSKRGRKPKVKASSMASSAEVVSTTPAKRGRKPKTATVTVPVDAVVVAKIPAKRGRKPKNVSVGIQAVTATPAKRGRKPKVQPAAVPVNEAAVPAVASDVVKVPAKRGRKPKSTGAAVPGVMKDQPGVSGAIQAQESILENMELLLQRMTKCMEILSQSMEILVRDLKKES